MGGGKGTNEGRGKRCRDGSLWVVAAGHPTHFSASTQHATPLTHTHTYTHMQRVTRQGASSFSYTAAKALARGVLLAWLRYVD